MPLRELAAGEEWVQREDPRVSVWRAVRDWIAALGTTPWQAPSAPFPELSDLPPYQLRTAEVPGTGIEVFYRREFDGEFVDVVWVKQLSP